MTNDIEKKGELGELPFGIVRQSDILTVEDLDSLEPLKDELKQTFLQSQVFRTRTEMEISVLNDMKHPTPASKYWQSVREQNVMLTELVSLSYEYRKNQVEIKILERDIKSEPDELKRELMQIDIEKKQFLARNHEKTAKDRIREIRQWSEIKAREAEKMKPEELAGVDAHQLISYTKRWIKQASVMGENVSQGERQNLVGQLMSGVKECKLRGVLPLVFEGLNPESPLVKELAEKNQILLQ